MLVIELIKHNIVAAVTFMQLSTALHAALMHLIRRDQDSSVTPEIVPYPKLAWPFIPREQV